MVSGKDDDCAPEQVALLERIQQPADLRIGKRDLADIGVEVTRPVRLGRVVRPVRIVEVRPQKKGAVFEPHDPADRISHDFIAAALESPRPRSSLVGTSTYRSKPCASPRSDASTTDDTNAPVRKP